MILRPNCRRNSSRKGIRRTRLVAESLEQRRLLAGDLLATELSTELVESAYHSRAVGGLLPANLTTVTREVDGGAVAWEETNSAFEIDFVFGENIRNLPDFMEVARRAADYWRTRVFDPITVVIQLDTVDLRGGIDSEPLAFASPVEIELPYADVRSALIGDSELEPDDSIVSALPGENGLTVALADRLTTVDTVTVTKANLKAIGLHNDTLDFETEFADGQIIVNSDAFDDQPSSFAFDTDNSDGVDEGTFDLETLLVHEIGHVLGFISATDTVGVTPSPDSVAIAPMDLFRFQSASGLNNPRTPAEFSSARRELRRENEAVLDFVLNDGWTTIENEYSVEYGSGQFGGQQASHWLDLGLNGSMIGIMGPTQRPGEIVPMSNVDLRALDLIGYDILPPDLDPVAPVAINDSVSIIEDASVLLNVTSNDLFVGNASIRLLDTPTYGIAVVEDGQIRYTPEPEFSGSALIRYQVTDHNGLTSLPAEVVITVQSVNDAPVSRDDFAVTSTATAVSINVLANDSDIDDTLDATGIEIVSQPSGGTVSQNNDGLLIYLPDTGFTGVDSFLYRISDGQRSSADALVTITVDATLTPGDLDVRQRDVNADGRVSAVDALMIINQLSRTSAEGESAELNSIDRFDVNRDGRVSAIDALSIINHMRRTASAVAIGEWFDDLDDENERESLKSPLDGLF